MTQPPDIGDVIGRYHLLSELGRGSMGRVYLAEDPNIDRKVALKVYCPEGVEADMEEDLEKRFVTEAQAAGRLNHPGIVTIHDAGRASDHSYIAMEWVAGPSLEQLLDRHQRLPVATAVDFVCQIARALDYAHREGVVHRDIKPANVLVRQDGRVQVMDFGIAKLGTQSLTLAGAILGTPTFMSPEQISTRTVDGRSDLFSLGTVLYLCLTGKSPFAADSIPAVADRIAHLDVPPVRSLDPSLPEALSRVVDRALCKQPDERFQSGEELARALEGACPDLVRAAVPANLDELDLENLDDLKDLPALDATILAEGAAETGLAEPGTSSRRPGRLAAVTGAGLLIAVGLWALLGAGGESIPEDAAASLPGLAAATGEPAPSAAAREASVAPSPVMPRPAAPPPKPMAAAPLPDAAVELIYQNRLRQCEISILVDGKPSWSGHVTSKNFFRRLAKGEQLRVVIPLTPGKHSIAVRIVRQPEIDASAKISATLKSKETRQLQVSLKRRANEVQLDWVAP